MAPYGASAVISATVAARGPAPEIDVPADAGGPISSVSSEPSVMVVRRSRTGSLLAQRTERASIYSSAQPFVNTSPLTGTSRATRTWFAGAKVESQVARAGSRTLLA